MQVSVFADVCALRLGTGHRAAACGVRGCMLVPLFAHPDPGLMGPVAILELVQRGCDVACFPALFNWLGEKLPVRWLC